MSVIKGLVPGTGWEQVRYYVFDAVPIVTLLEPGKISNTNFKKRIVDMAFEWYYLHGQKITWIPKASTGFKSRFARLKKEELGKYVVLHPQTLLPMQTEKAHEIVLDELDQITNAGGEGLIIRAPNALYECCRTHSMVKLKKLNDMEGTVVGYITGRKTDLGSKLLGMMGALVLELDDGNRLELSGFTESERTLIDKNEDEAPACEWAEENPEKECPDWISAKHFPRGSRVTFRYRGKSEDGIPQEARYWRKHDAG
jgi:ATP-dependent DNA ligase